MGLRGVVPEMEESISSSERSKSKSKLTVSSWSETSLPASVVDVKVDRCVEVERLDGAIERRPVCVRRRYRRSSVFCLRISRSRVRLMARREELLISRSSTLRSRRAFAANSFKWSILLSVVIGLVGLVDIERSGDFGSMAWGSLVNGGGSVVMEALLVSKGWVDLFAAKGNGFLEVAIESIELTLLDFP